MASDEQIKNYLSDKLCEQKQYNQRLGVEHSKLKDQLKSRIQMSEQLKVALDHMTNQKQKEIETAILNEQKKQAELQQSSLAREEQLVLKHRTDTQLMENRYKHEIKQLTDKLNRMQQNYDVQHQRRSQLQSKERELSRNLSNTQKELSLVSKQLEQARISNKELNDLKHHQITTITELNCRVESLTRQLNDKTAIIQSSKELKDSANSQKQALETRIEEEKRKYEKLQLKFEQAREEYTRVATIMEEYKEKNNLRKQKIAQRNEIIKNQERRVQELERIQYEAQKKENDLKREIESAQLKISDLQMKNTQLKTILQDTQKREEQQNTLVAHLNRKLTEKTSGMRSIYPTTTYPTSIPHTIGKSPLSSSIDSQPYETGVSRLRQSTSPLQRSDRVQPQIKKYVPMEQPTIPMTTLSQQKDPEDMLPTMTTETSNKIRPIRYRPPE